MNWYKAGHREKDTKDSTASFAQAGTRENIQSGEKHKTLFGKIARYFADLKMVAFTGSYDDLNGKPSSFPPSSHTHTKSQVSDFAHTHKKAEITDFPSSLPASDVPAWAKAANKPSYTWNEISAKPTSMPASDVSAWAKAANKPSYNWSEINNKPTELSLNKIISNTEGITGDWGAPTGGIKGKTVILSEYGEFILAKQKLSDNSISKKIRFKLLDAPRNNDDYGIMPVTDNTCSLGHYTTYWDESYIDYMYTSRLMSRETYQGGEHSSIHLGGLSISIGWNSKPVMKFDSLYGSPEFSPATNGKCTIGSSTNKWNQMYATNASIQTSDRNEKRNISYMGKDSGYITFMSDNDLKSFIRGLLPVIYNRIDGESGRPHHGFVAQDVEELLERLGITDHAGFIKSPKMEKVITEAEEEEIYIDEADAKAKTRTVTKQYIEYKEIPGEYVYGLRYEEFIADIVRFVQLQDEKIQEQDEKIKDLEERLSLLEDMIKAS